MIGPASGAVSLIDEARMWRVAKGPSCSVGTLLADPGIGAELAEALASTVMSSAITAALKARGYPASEYTIARHRRGACKCRS